MRDRFGKGAGKGALVKWEHAPCIAAAQDTTLFVYMDSDLRKITASTVDICESALLRSMPRQALVETTSRFALF